jgi:DME family drug/metabolite transporter
LLGALMIAALAPWLLGERLRPRGGALLLGVLGTALLVAAPRGARPVAAISRGVLLAFVAGLAYALYVLVAKATLRRSAPLPATALTFTIGALLLTPALVWTAPRDQLALGWPWLCIWGRDGGRLRDLHARSASVPASVAGVTTLLEPLTATILGVALRRAAWPPGSWARYFR